MMLLERVRAGKVASLCDIPQHLQVRSAFWPWGPCCPQPTELGASLLPKPGDPVAPSPCTVQRKTGW